MSLFAYSLSLIRLFYFTRSILCGSQLYLSSMTEEQILHRREVRRLWYARNKERIKKANAKSIAKYYRKNMERRRARYLLKRYNTTIVEPKPIIESISVVKSICKGDSTTREIFHSAGKVGVTVYDVTLNCQCGWHDRRGVPSFPATIQWHCDTCGQRHATKFV